MFSLWKVAAFFSIHHNVLDLSFLLIVLFVKFCHDYLYMQHLS